MRVLVVLCILLTGCLDDGAPVAAEGEVPASCNPGRPSENAPPIASLRGDVAEVAGRIAAALGKELPAWNDERSDRHISAWHGDDLHIEYHHDDGRWQISRPDRWPTSTSQLEAFVDGLGASGLDVTYDRVGQAISFVQEWRGVPVGATYSEALPGDGSGRMGWWSGFTFNGLRDMSDARVSYSEAAATGAGRSMIRCVLDAEGQAEAAGYAITDARYGGIDVHADSVVHQVEVFYSLPEPGHCGGAGRVALVDAETGGLLGWEWVPCA